MYNPDKEQVSMATRLYGQKDLLPSYFVIYVV